MTFSLLPPPTGDRRRWLALVVVCLAQLMIVLDTTIVNVALPTIQRDLHFTQGNLTWVVNAFLVTFGSLLLLAGRLGDLLGRKRVFITGVIVFTAASALCGLALSQGMLIGARFLQGAGAALQASVILAIIVTEFAEPGDRARAMSAYVFVAVAGGSLGLLAGGALTETLGWHWIFFVNLPIGAATLLLGRALIRADDGRGLGHGVDWLGSILVTVSLMSAVYAIVQATSHGWTSTAVLGFGALAAVLMASFLALESRIANPIMPLAILRLRGLVGSSVVRGFLVAAMYTTFFLGTLYLEHVRHYTAMQTGLAFLPWTVTVGILSLGITARLVGRFGPMRVLLFGLSAVIAGLALLGTTGLHTGFFPTVFLAFFAVGLGIGSSFMPLLTIAMADVPAADAGLGSGIVNVSMQVAGALGLAALGTIATNHTKALLAAHHALAPSLVSGYHLAFALGVAIVAVAILTALALLRTHETPVSGAEELPRPAHLHRDRLGRQLRVGVDLLGAHRPRLARGTRSEPRSGGAFQEPRPHHGLGHARPAGERAMTADEHRAALAERHRDGIRARRIAREASGVMDGYLRSEVGPMRGRRRDGSAEQRGRGRRRAVDAAHRAHVGAAAQDGEVQMDLGRSARG
jgi:EmrB/QacA subfamily drug resistance transporter